MNMIKDFQNNLKASDSALLKVPALLSRFYRIFNNAWHVKVRAADNTLVKLRNQRMVYGDSAMIGWDIQTDNMMEWVPTSWLLPIPDDQLHLRFTGLCDTCGGINLHESACRSIS